jgi:tRNA (Thr-GGU) A37 N-methylase
MADCYTIYPVGVVRKTEEAAWIEIFADYRDALLGLEGFSHVHVLFWFHENDTPNFAGPYRCTPGKIPPIR